MLSNLQFVTQKSRQKVKFNSSRSLFNESNVGCYNLLTTTARRPIIITHLAQNQDEIRRRDDARLPVVVVVHLLQRKSLD